MHKGERNYKEKEIESLEERYKGWIFNFSFLLS